ncbi:MAG TPA: DAHL domain-containing protein, partial [Polyangiaceae bacterium]|nr:DAHL domain-containing protein [Polyangiaceae bacterium]
MSRIIRILAVLAVAAFVAVGVFEYTKRLDLVGHDQYSRDARAIEALDARLSFEIMRSREGLSASYDGIVETEHAIGAIEHRLGAPPTYLSQNDASAVGAAATRLADTMTTKESLIEHFKSENSVLRNSGRFFPGAAERLRDDLSSSGDAETARLVNEVLTSVLRFEESPTSRDAHDRAQLAIDLLAGAKGPAWADDDLESVLEHAQVVLDRGDTVAALVNEILAVPSSNEAIAFDSTYQRGYTRAVRAGEHRRSLLFALALVALVLVGVDIIVRLRRSAAKERAANETLARANEALFREKERERELRELKSRFVSMTSHEFRTPLSVILSSTELLEAYGPRWTDAKRADHYARVKAAIRSMTDLLDGILVIGRAEMGKLEYAPSPFDVGRWARELADAFRPTVGKKHTFVAEIDGDFEDAWGDEKILNHVFTNLLSNAVKYSPSGGTVKFALR